VYPTYVRPAPLSGVADVNNSNANLIVAQQQANLMQQDVYKAKYGTRKAALDQTNYEIETARTATDDLERTKALNLRNAVNVASNTQITSGVALNRMLPSLLRLTATGTQGPPIPLDAEQLKKINVKVPGNSDNVGLFRNGGKLEWPSACTGPLQEKLDELIPALLEQVRDGNLSQKTYNEARKAATDLQADIKRRFYADEIDGTSWVAGKRYMENVTSGIKALQDPNARQLLGGGYAATGRTVDELVLNMSKQGLQFAAATPGDEPAYFALYNAMSSYTAAATNDSAFRVQIVQPVRAPRQ
jgi:hypothetical protein